jgi:FkbM family methyltransferase
MLVSGGFYFPDNERHFTALGDDVANYQKPQREKAYEYVQNWRCAVDIGAHVGIFSCDFAQRFERVVAFEPMPSTRECLLRNVPGNVDVKPFACGSHPGKVRMERSTKNSGGSRIIAADAMVDSLIEVEVVTLDSFGFEAVDLIKLDVEGFEPEAILGAEQTMRRCMPVVIVEEKLKPGNFDHVKRASELLLSFGYSKGELVGADRIYVVR